MSKAFASDFIPVLVLKNCKPDLSNILPELFHMRLKESCFPDYWIVSSVVPAFNKCRDNRCPCKMWLFSDFQYGFRYSQSNVDLLTVVFDTIPAVSNKSEATPAVVLHISKVFDKEWHVGLLHKRKSYGT